MSGIKYHKTTAAKIQLLPYRHALEFKGLTSIELFTQTDITDITVVDLGQVRRWERGTHQPRSGGESRRAVT